MYALFSIKPPGKALGYILYEYFNRGILDEKSMHTNKKLHVPLTLTKRQGQREQKGKGKKGKSSPRK